MDVEAISVRGFKIVARGVKQSAVEQARAEVDGVLEKHGVTAADIRTLEHRFMELGQQGYDLAQMTNADWKGFNVDPKHVRANKHIFEALKAARKLGSEHPGSVIAFKAYELHR